MATTCLKVSPKEKVMRSIIALIIVLSSGAALAQQVNRTYQDAMGRNTGRSVTDRRGNTTYYEAMGRNTGRSVPVATAPSSTTRWVGRPARSEGASDGHAPVRVNTGHEVDRLIPPNHFRAGEAFRERG